MRAVIFATGKDFAPTDHFFNDQTPVPMIPLLDRPFVQHVVEYCVAQGVVQFDWVLSHLPEEMERFLGSGERWGARFRYHLVRNPDHPYGVFNTLVQTIATEPILLGHADRLPAFDLANLPGSELSSSCCCTLFGAPPNPEREPDSTWIWSGWGVVSPGCWQLLSGGSLDEAGLLRKLISISPGSLKRKTVSRLLSVQSFPEILQANRTLLNGPFPGLFLDYLGEESKVRVARTARIDPTAVLIPPVFVGPGCELAAGSRVGPNVVLGNDCLIDRNSLVANTVLFSGTYVAKESELTDVVVNRNQLMNAMPGHSLFSSMNRLAVGCLRSFTWSALGSRLASMILGSFLLLLGSPILLLTIGILKLCRGKRGVFHPRQCLRLPASQREREWKTFSLWSLTLPECWNPSTQMPVAGWSHFFLEFLPGLLNVARGDIRLVGVPPRSCQEVQQLDADWKSIYLQGNAGLLYELLLLEDELSAGDSFAREGILVLAPGFLLKLRIFLTYLGRILWRPRRGLANSKFDLYKLGKVEIGSAIVAPVVETEKGEHPFSVDQVGSQYPEANRIEIVPAVMSKRMGSMDVDLAPTH